MASTEEMVEAIADLLVRGAVRDLPMSFPNSLPEEVSAMIKAVIARCAQRGLTLASVTVRPSLAADLKHLELDSGVYSGVPILVRELEERDACFKV